MSIHPIAAAVATILCGFSQVYSEKPQLSSDRDIEFDAENGSTVARGNATLTHGALTVVADEIRYLGRENEALATGRVRVNYGTYRLVGQGLTYHIAEERIVSDAFRMGAPPLLAEGEGFSGTREKVEISEAVIYFNEPHFATPNIRARTATLYPGDRVEAENVTVRIGNWPVFYLPHLSRPLGDSGITMAGDFGYRGNLGAYLRLGGLFPFSHTASVGMNLDGYTERGVLAGPRLTIDATRADGSTTSSRLDSGWIRDSGDRGADIHGQPVDSGRWFLRWTHRQRAGKKISLLANLEAWSDSEVLRDFRHEAFLRNQDPDSHFEAVYRGEGYFLSAFARIRPNSFQTVRERLPEVRFDWMPREIAETGLYHSANAAVARLKEEFAENALPGNPLYLAEFGIAGTDTDPVLSSNRFLLHYKLQRPVKINKWVNFVPLAGLQTVSYTDQEVDWSQGPTPLSTRPDDLTRVFGEIGFDLEMKAYATWDYQNKIWGIDGLRHILRPVVRYRYHFTDDDSTPSFVRIDRRAFSTSLPPIDLGNIRYVDDLGQSSVLRFGVENLLQTRDDSWGSKDLVEFNIYQDVLFTADPGEDTWTGLYTQLAVRPIHWLQVDFYSQIRPESFDLAASRARISVVNGDLWRLAVDTESLEAQVEQYRAAFSYRFNQRWSGTASLRYDSRLGKITEHAYTVHQRLANTWNLAYQLIFRSGAVREDEAQFNIRVDLVRF